MLPRRDSFNCAGRAFAMQSDWMPGAGRVIAIDRVPERLRMAEQHSKAETITLTK